MDSATQALLGAVVGQAGFSHKLGRRALVWGAIGGLLPDLDVFAGLATEPFGEWVHHRGTTHALWFGPVLGPPLGWLVWRHYARKNGQNTRGSPGDPALRSAWMGLMTLALFTHPLIDIFTTYGTQLFAPFSRQRFALNSVGIIDPIYSGLLVAGLLAGWWMRRRPARVRAAAFTALALSWGYLFYGWWLNENARLDLQQQLASVGHADAPVNVYPTLLQPYLRRSVARVGEEIWVGLHTPLGGGQTAWERFRPTPPGPLVRRVEESEGGRIFQWFAMGETVARVRRFPGGTSVEIDDLRYGFPGDPERGLFGIRATFDAEGKLQGEIQRTRYQPSAPSLRALWRATLGDFSALDLPPPSPGLN
ncbi:MAG: metal-dependent hydrolase [Myxococcota bacterium]